MKPLQRHLHAGIRRVHIDIDDTPALELAEAKTALAKLQDTLAESQTVLAAKDAALEDIATQLENLAHKADDLQAQLNTEKERTDKQKRLLNVFQANHTNAVNQWRPQIQKAVAELRIEKEVTERQRLELETLRAKVENPRSAPLPMALLVSPKPPARASTRSYDLPTVLTASSTTPKPPCPTFFGGSGRGGSPAKRSRIDSPHTMRIAAHPGGEKK